MPEPRSRATLVALLGIGGAALLGVLFVLFVPLGTPSPAGQPGASPDRLVVGGHPLLGKPAPEIDLATLDGDALTLSGLRGRPVLINFWATWCPPCREEFPLMVEAYAEHADDGLEILGVLHDDLPDGARRFAADMGATWPILEDPQDVAHTDYIVPGLPTSYFIDADGIVRAFSLGGFSREGLAAQLATVLPSPSAVPTS